MQEKKHKEHDFSAKLRQASVIDRLKVYIQWRRDQGKTNKENPLPKFGPLSINLDLTSACNFACPHCVDSGIINTGEHLDLDTVKASLDTLQSQGLLSVILLGGGEPTLHKNFEEIVRYIKGKDLQLGIVTNGTRLGRVEKVSDVLTHKDWLRISIDAACQETFFQSHRPKSGVNLYDILSGAREIKSINPQLSLGYSFVIVWEGIAAGEHQLYPNISEIPQAVQLAREFGFDYISFKPCLLRLEVNQKESLFDPPDIEREKKVINDIKLDLAKAKEVAQGQIKILESINLRALLEGKVHELKKQPEICHMQFFRTVLSPAGLFHCPAFRGNEKAKISDQRGYLAGAPLQSTLQNLTRSITGFDAAKECCVIACFYHHVNWWIEDFIHSDREVEALETISDQDFFL
ncbi:MAG: radical SAM protein [Desulfobacterales bacterium]|jgi:sulfatase maturation enzyme AslB (radical SAM superfamily)